MSSGNFRLQQDLSGLSRDDLLTLIAAQQNQLHSRVQLQELQEQSRVQQLQEQQQQQQQQASLSANSFWAQQRSLTAAAPSSQHQQRLQDLMMPSASSSFGGNARLAAALLHTDAASASAKPGMAELLLRSQMAAEAPAAASQHGGVTTADLLQARARFNMNAAAASAPPSDPYSTTMRSIMLRKELLAGGNTSTSGNAFGNNGMPGAGSSEDGVLRNLLTTAAAEHLAQHQHQQRQLGSVMGNGGEQNLLDSLATTTGTAGRIMNNSASRNLSAEELFILMGGRGHLNPQAQVTPAPAVNPLPVPQAATADHAVPRRPDAPTGRRGPAAGGAGGGGKGRALKPAKKAKRPLSAYNIYFKEEHAKIIAHNLKERAEKEARGEHISSEDEYEDDPDAPEGEKRKRKRSLSTNQPGKRGKRQVDFENLTKVIGKRWKELPKDRVDSYKKRAEEAMQAYRKNLFQKIRMSVKDDQSG